MKKFYQLIPGFSLMVYSTGSFGQANTKLSNLAGPVAINAPLLPNINNTQTLGSSALAWRSVYLFDGLYIKGNLALFSPGTDNFFGGRIDGNTTLTGNSKTGFGTRVLNSLTTGTNNTSVGVYSLNSTTGGNYNTAVGSNTLNRNVNGNNNTATGYRALRSNSGSHNTANGSNALEINGSGNYNTASGTAALYNNSSGSNNTAVGTSASYFNRTASENVAVGWYALQQNQDGMRNTSIGANSLNQTKSSTNTALGYSAGYIHANGNYNTYVGAFSGSSAAGYAFSTALGYFSKTTASSQIRIGSTSISSIGGYANWTNISDGRFKKEIKEDVVGLDFVNRLRPVTYFLDISGLNSFLSPGEDQQMANAEKNEQQKVIAEKEKIRYSGFVAQEVVKTAGESKYAFSGVDVPVNEHDVYGLRYAEFVVPIVKSVQELSIANDEKKKEIEELRGQIKELKEMVEGLAKNNNVGFPLDKGGSLAQNVPNPSKNSTTISYSLPEKYRLAELMVLDAGGKSIKKINLSDRQGIVTINTNTMATGTYTYSLLVDGSVLQTKRMVLAR